MNRWAIVVLILFLPVPGNTATYYVDLDAGNDSSTGTSQAWAWLTTAKVEAEIASGDSVYFKRGGTTTDTLTLESLTTITLDAYGSGARPTLGAIQLTTVTASTINRFNLDGRGAGGEDSLLYGTGTDDLTIFDCLLQYGTIWPLHVRYSDRVLISSTTMSNNLRGGGALEYCTVSTFTHCLSYHNGRPSPEAGDDCYGLAATYGGPYWILNCEVYGNGPADSDRDYEINVFQATTACVVAYNYVHDTDQGGITIAQGGSQSVIKYNVIDRYGSCTDTAKLGNGKFSAISLEGTTGGTSITIANNTIANGGMTTAVASAGISCHRSGYGGLVVKNNIIAYTTGRLIEFNSIAVPTGITLDNNVYYTTSALYIYGWIKQYNTLATWQTASGQDASAQEIDPLFRDYTNLDYRVTAFSPVIDSGADLGYSKDRNGNNVPQRAFVDCGAHEYAWESAFCPVGRRRDVSVSGAWGTKATDVSGAANVWAVRVSDTATAVVWNAKSTVVSGWSAR